MRRGLDWYKRDPISFLDGVQGMGPELIGAYAVILDLIHARAGESRRDDRHLAGILGCSTRKAASLTDALIDRGKVSVEGGLLTNSRAKTTAKSRRDLSEMRANAGRNGGLASGESRRAKGLAEANASSKHEPEKRREEKETPKGVSKRGSRLPEDWHLPKAWGEWALENTSLSVEQIRTEAEKFRDHWIAKTGKDATKGDWFATWRNWCRNARPQTPPKGPNGGQSDDRLARKIARFSAAGSENSTADGDREAGGDGRDVEGNLLPLRAVGSGG